jgi:hypothetical protein
LFVIGLEAAVTIGKVLPSFASTSFSSACCDFETHQKFEQRVMFTSQHRSTRSFEIIFASRGLSNFISNFMLESMQKL